MAKKRIVDIDFLRFVEGDLRVLFELWGEEADSNMIRVTSPILRKLLATDNGPKNLLDAWRDVGFRNQPHLSSVEIGGLLKKFKDVGFYEEFSIQLISKYFEQPDIPPGRIIHEIPSDEAPVFIAAGGGFLKQTQFANITIKLGGLDNGNAIKEPEYSKTSVSKFLYAPCFFLLGKTIRRSEFIKFMVNKRGGAHFEKGALVVSTRKREDLKLQEEKFILLDIFRRAFKSRFEGFGKGWDFMNFELLSIGQSLISSDEIKSLYKRLTGIIDEEDAKVEAMLLQNPPLPGEK